MGEMLITFPSGVDGDDLQGPIVIYIHQGSWEQVPGDGLRQVDQPVSPDLVNPDLLTRPGRTGASLPDHHLPGSISIDIGVVEFMECQGLPFNDFSGQELCPLGVESIDTQFRDSTDSRLSGIVFQKCYQIIIEAIVVGVQVVFEFKAVPLYFSQLLSEGIGQVLL